MIQNPHYAHFKNAFSCTVAATTIRLLEFGAKLSFVGVICSAFLIPSYKFGSDSTLESTGNITDSMDAISLSNVPIGDPASIATTMGAYVLFGSAMYFILKDIEWFQEHRREFLSKKTAQNYSIFISGLPEEYQNDEALKEHFDKLGHHGSVVEARVALKIPNLESEIATRDALVPKLEHAINVRVVKGTEPMHKTKMCGGEKVESIPTYDKELGGLNEDIAKAANTIENKHKLRDTNGGDAENPDENKAAEETSKDDLAARSDSSPSVPKSSTKLAALTSSLKAAFSSEDGAARDAGFVSFANLTSANLALQAVQHHKPFVCDVQSAPSPEQVEWKNVGVSTKIKHIGELISLFLTALLCVFWTIPVAFFASLSNVEALVGLIPALGPAIENNPWLGQVIAQLAPFILVIFVSLLPVFLLTFVGLEKHITIATYQHPSLFNKVAWFTIIQTFFVSTISGAITSELQNIIDNGATYAIELFAKALPAQASYFIQIILVQNLLGLGTELLRTSALVQALLRYLAGKLLGFGLTEKERSSSFLGLRVYSDPSEYEFGRKLGGETILLFMVLFVYGSMSPIVCYFTLFVFLLLTMGFRNQFCFIYPIANDSGGKLFVCFIKVGIICMIIAQVVLVGVLALKQSPIAVGLMVPLILVTVLFNSYLNKKHYYVTGYLPTEDCIAMDKKNEESNVSLDFLNESYLQPALKASARETILPENYNEISGSKVDSSANAAGTGVEDVSEEEHLASSTVVQTVESC
jgi:calcium permeable stress-gated cation channel